jgi:hypothetical protein
MRSVHRLKGVGEKGNYLNPENGDMTTVSGLASVDWQAGWPFPLYLLSLGREADAFSFFSRRLFTTWKRTTSLRNSTWGRDSFFYTSEGIKPQFSLQLNSSYQAQKVNWEYPLKPKI